ncbi:putative F-box protein At4g17565 isoform X2 [Tasmannia lanceolata]
MWWRSVAKKKPNTSSPLPWLLLSENQNSVTRSFFSPYESRVYNLKLPEARGFECRGSSGQWMIMTDGFARCFLLNPFSRSRVQLPYNVSFLRGLKFDPWRLKKAVIFPPPTFEDQKTIADNRVVVALTVYGGLFSCQIGGETWTPIGKKGSEYEDFIFFKGFFYAMTGSGELQAFNLGDKPRRRWRKVLSRLPSKPNGYLRVAHHFSYHLMESCGELLMVVGYCLEPRDFCSHYEGSLFGNICATGTFRVFKLDQSAPKWVLVESIGDYILFLGTSGSVSLKSSGLLGFKGNSICFAHRDNEHPSTSGSVSLKSSGLLGFKGNSISSAHRNSECRCVNLWMFCLENGEVNRHIPIYPHLSQLYNSLKWTNISFTPQS